MNTPTPPPPPLGANALAPPVAIVAGPNRIALRVRDRLTAISEIVEEHGGRVPSHSRLLKLLRERGLRTSKGSTLNDLRTLGLTNAPSARVPQSISLTEK